MIKANSPTQPSTTSRRKPLFDSIMSAVAAFASVAVLYFAIIDRKKNLPRVLYYEYEEPSSEYAVVRLTIAPGQSFAEIDCVSAPGFELARTADNLPGFCIEHAPAFGHWSPFFFTLRQLVPGRGDETICFCISPISADKYVIHLRIRDKRFPIKYTVTPSQISPKD
nr:MAG TPA: hypothetical protein [Caudoviricetes sp.]